MEALEFYLVSRSKPAMTIQPGAHGAPVRVQPLTYSAAQRWVMQPQISNGVQGIALVNPASGLCIVDMGYQQPVVGQTYSRNTANHDVWRLVAGEGGSVRIASSRDERMALSNWGGHWNSGDVIVPYHDHAANSNFRIELATRLQAEGEAAEPELAGEPAEATA